MSDTKQYVIELGGDLGDIATMHRLVRCKECAHVREEPLTRCGYVCDYLGFQLPDPDFFCAWGEKRED